MPAAAGAAGPQLLQVTGFDPDYDPDGVYAREVADTLVARLAPLLPIEIPAEEPDDEPAGQPVAVRDAR